MVGVRNMHQEGEDGQEAVRRHGQQARFLLLFACFANLGLTVPASADTLPIIRTVTASSQQVTLFLSAATQFSQGSLAQDPTYKRPNRCYIDVSPAHIGSPSQATLAVSPGPIHAVRAAQYSPDTARVVLDLFSSQTCDVQVLSRPERIQITVETPLISERYTHSTPSAWIPKGGEFSTRLARRPRRQLHQLYKNRVTEPPASIQPPNPSHTEPFRPMAPPPTNTSQTSPLTVSMDMANQYIWRGLNLNSGDLSVFPSMTYSIAALDDLSITAWSWIGVGTDRASGAREDAEVHEVDVSVGYEKELIPEQLTGSLSFTGYHYLSDWSSLDGTNRMDYELTAELSYALTESLFPFVSYSRGLDDGIAGDYVEVGTVLEHTFNEHWAITPFISTGFTPGSDLYPRSVSQELTHLTLSLPVTYTQGSWSIAPFFDFVLPLADINQDFRKKMFVGGVNVTFGGS